MRPCAGCNKMIADAEGVFYHKRSVGDVPFCSQGCANQNIGQVWINLTAKETLFIAEQRLAKARDDFLAAQLEVMNAQWILYDLERGKEIAHTP